MAASMDVDDVTDLDVDAYYAILMVDKNASVPEINAAYKRLSLQFHPDKHASPEAKKAAENLFNRIKRAKDVLIDPQLRSIYDAVGLKGLKEFENSRLVRKDMQSSKEIIEEYQRLMELKRYQEEINSYNPNAMTEMTLDMCSVFESGYYDEDHTDRITILDQISDMDISRMRMSHGFTVPVGDQNDVNISSLVTVDFDKGHKVGQVNCQWQRRLINKVIGTTISIGTNPQMGVNGFWQFMKDWSVNGSLTCNFVQGRLVFGINSGLNIQLSHRLRAEFTTSLLAGETLKYGMSYSGDSYTVSGDIQTGVSYYSAGHSPTRLSLRASKTFKDHDFTIKGHTLLALTSYKLSIGFSKLFPARQSHLHTHLEVDSLRGVILLLSLQRGRQTYRLPIIMSNEIQPFPVLYGLLLPALVYAAVKSVLIVPYLKEQRAKAIQKKKEQQKEATEKRRLDALDEVSIMKPSVDNAIILEEQMMGLIIVKALYGKLETVDSSGDTANEEIANVTIPLQNQVKNSALKIPVNISKVNIPGFYDPCFGEEKKLYIRYKFHGRLHQVTLSDNEPIYIPKQGHLITNIVSTES